MNKKNQIYNQLGEKHKNLLRAQNQKGIDDYKAANPSESSDTIEETYYDSDRYLDALNKKGGLNVVEIGSKSFMISGEEGKKVVSAVTVSQTGGGYTPNLNRQVPLLTADGKLNYEGFSILAQGKQLTRTVPATTETKTTTTDTKDDNTSTTVTEATLGGDTIPLVTETETETGTETNAEELITLKDVSTPVSEEWKKKMNESNDKTISERKKLEEEIAKLKEALKEGGYEEEKDAEERKSASSDDYQRFPEEFGEKKVEAVTSKTGTNPPNMSLTKQEMLNELGELQREKDRIEQVKADLAEGQKA